MSPLPVILSVAGYDPSSGAGITADIKTAAAQGCYAASCITALTVQSTQGVFGIESVRPETVRATLDALADDFPIAAVRLGMLGSGDVASVVADFLESAHLSHVVVDPVIRSSSGTELLDSGGLEVLRTRLLPLAEVVTPNIAEAAMLAGTEPVQELGNWQTALPQIRCIAAELHNLGAKSVVITGGHLDPANDYLSSRVPGDAQEVVIEGERLHSRSTHGTGCAYAMATACRLALGDDLECAARAAKDYVRRAIVSAHTIGKGIGSVNHFV